MTRTTHREHTATHHPNRAPVPDHRPGAPRRTRFPVPAVERAWRRKALRTAIKAGAVAALFVLLMEPFGALANYYERGNWRCSDFARAERHFRAEPDNINRQIAYALCLMTRDKGDDETRSMAILHNIVDHSIEPERVKAAWMIASYLSSGGTFENTIGENIINEAIDAYGRVVFFIALDPNYPRGNGLYEEEAQMELKSHYRLPMLYFAKFK